MNDHTIFPLIFSLHSWVCTEGTSESVVAVCGCEHMSCIGWSVAVQVGNRSLAIHLSLDVGLLSGETLIVQTFKIYMIMPS